MTDIRTDEVKVAITDLPDASPSDPLEALSWLGETVEEIAEGLRARGIKGRLSHPYACPLHNYLTNWGWDYTVTRLWLRNRDIINWEMIDVPSAVSSFIHQFDAGSFPDLIDNG